MSHYYPRFCGETPSGIISVEDAEELVLKGRAEFATKRGKTIVKVLPPPEAERILVPLNCASEDVQATIARYLPPDWEAWENIQAWIGEDTVFFVGKKDGKTVQIFLSGKSGNAVEDVLAEGKKQGRTRTFYIVKSKEAKC